MLCLMLASFASLGTQYSQNKSEIRSVSQILVEFRLEKFGPKIKIVPSCNPSQPIINVITQGKLLCCMIVLLKQILKSAAENSIVKTSQHLKSVSTSSL